MAIKRCPTCNQEFTDEWLTFCTNDGSSLVPVERSSEEPPPTIVAGWMPPSVSPLEQPTLDLPGAASPPPQIYRPPQSIQPGATPFGSVQPGWKVPPPPTYPASTEKNMALLSMIFGIVSVTVGWCCYFGVLTAPVAIGLGIYSLSQIKRDPNKYGGKGMAIGGLVTGGLYFVLLLFIILIYGLSFLMSGMN